MKPRTVIFFLATIILIQGSAWAQTAGSDTAKSFTVKKRKPNPRGALLRSAFVPGWGQLYNKKYIKAAIFAGGEGYLFYGIASDWRNANNHEKAFKNAIDPALKAAEFNAFEKYRDRRNVKMWILTAAIFYSMFDAYVDAQLADFEETDKAYEVFLTPVRDDGLMAGVNLRF